MYKIICNMKASRTLDISEKQLQTIEKYALFEQLVDSNGIIDESVLEKLKLNIRSLIVGIEGNCKDLLDLCINVIYHDNMKALGLKNLVKLYSDWKNQPKSDAPTTEL